MSALREVNQTVLNVIIFGSKKKKKNFTANNLNQEEPKTNKPGNALVLCPPVTMAPNRGPIPA